MSDEENYKVYVHINRTNGKLYLGLTKQPILRRWNHGNSYKRCPLFWRAIEKYGWDGFDHIVLKDGLSKDEAADMERALISIFGTTNPNRGYNCNDGGFAGSLSVATKEKLRVANIGKRYSLETCLRHSISSRKRDVQFTELARRKAKEAKRQTVLQYDKDRNLLRKWDSISEASKAVGVCHQNIVRCCQGKSHTCGGYYWAYPNIGIVEPKKRPEIVQVDADMGHVIATYESIQDASAATKISKENICAVCNGRRHKAGGYKWARKEI